MMRKPNRPEHADMEIKLEELLGSLGGALSQLVDAATMAGQAETLHEKTIQTPKGPIQARAGISVRTTLGNRPQVGRPDPARAASTPASSAKDTFRAPATEVHKEDDAWIVIAEVPGAESETVALSLDNGVLTFEARGARAYRGEVECPVGLRLDDIEITLTNGILELRAKEERDV